MQNTLFSLVSILVNDGVSQWQKYTLLVNYFCDARVRLSEWLGEHACERESLQRYVNTIIRSVRRRLAYMHAMDSAPPVKGTQRGRRRRLNLK